MPVRRPAPSIAVHGLFVTFGFVVAAFFPFLSLYLREKGLQEGEIGFVLATMAFARLLANPVWGHYADTRLGRLTVFQIGAAGAAVAALGLATVDQLASIAAMGFVLTAFMVATGPNADVIALEHLGSERMSDYGRIRAWESVSYAAACLAFGALFESAGVSWAIPVYAIAMAVVLAWSTTIGRDRAGHHDDGGRLGAVGAVFRTAPRFWGFLVAVLLIWTAFNAAWNFFSLKIADAGGGPFLVGVGTALGGLTEVPVMRVSSRLQLRWGLRQIFALGCLVYAVGFLAWGLVADPVAVSILTFLEGIGYSLLFTTTIVVVGRLLPSSLYSTGTSVAAMVAFGIGPIVGGGIGGLVYEFAGAVVLYVGAAAIAIAGAAAAWVALDAPALLQPGPLPSIEPGAAPDPGIVP